MFRCEKNLRDIECVVVRAFPVFIFASICVAASYHREIDGTREVLPCFKGTSPIVFSAFAACIYHK